MLCYVINHAAKCVYTRYCITTGNCTHTLPEYRTLLKKNVS